MSGGLLVNIGFCFFAYCVFLVFFFSKEIDADCRIQKEE